MSRKSSQTSLDSSDGQLCNIHVKVDRKLLEVMLNGGDSSQSLPSAEDFFLNISSKSQSIISFPQKHRLRSIGLKESEVLLIGYREQILTARRLILETLDPFRNKVTLKIDVSFPDHSHIIGKNGKRIQSIMDSTETHIHFPDGNRCSAEEKSNQVTIAGTSLEMAEQSRHLIRKNLPLTISFVIEVNVRDISLVDSAHPNIQYFQMSHNVIITFRFNEMSASVADKVAAVVSIRGTRLKVDDVRNAAFNVYQYLNGSTIGFNNLVVYINVEIAAQHQAFVRGRGDANIKAITAHTGAQILFPQPPVLGMPSMADNHSTTVVVKGRGIDSAYMAWLELLGYLPMLLIFDLKADQPIDGQLITSLMSNEMMSIVIRPKVRSNAKTIAIKIQEKNSSLLFNARELIVNMKEEKKISPILPPINAQINGKNDLKSWSGGKAPTFTRFGLSQDLDIETIRGFDDLLD